MAHTQHTFASPGPAGLAALAVASVLTWMDPGLTSAHVVAVDGATQESYEKYRQGGRLDVGGDPAAVGRDNRVSEVTG